MLKEKKNKGKRLLLFPLPFKIIKTCKIVFNLNTETSFQE